ncbi:PucR family transcriptional regulator [Microbacterium sp. AGC85]
MNDPEWAQILALLLEDRPRLVDDFLERLAVSGIYEGPALDAADLRRAASDTLELLIRRLAGLPTSVSLAGAPGALGVRRARQGVAQEALMEAVRLDFRVLWAGLVRASAHSSADILVRHAEEVLSTVERYIGEVQTAFLAESAALVRDERADNRRAFLRLLGAGADLEQIAPQVADAIGLGLDDALELVFVSAGRSTLARRLVDATHRQNDYVSADMDDGTVFVRPHLLGLPLASTLRNCAGGLVPAVKGIASLPKAIRLAERIAMQSSADHLVTERDVWLALTRDETNQKLFIFERTTESLDALPPPDRARLVETIRTYCATGSIKQTAERLFCHRNTVVNRLRMISDLTACDLTVPVEAAQLLIALGMDASDGPAAITEVLPHAIRRDRVASPPPAAR